MAAGSFWKKSSIVWYTCALMITLGMGSALAFAAGHVLFLRLSIIAFVMAGGCAIAIVVIRVKHHQERSR
ncbi:MULTISPECIES: hypothetical protein [unclassified Pseudonocardia]|uniref:hypothetical protein n=1 Tax=unclassified Pseudonocardia TaxID=2619320 RepID=UPI0001FFDDCD|nr:hypothetical protein [Pseudonocardia sp. Ae707_Ps1]OLM09106.1 hypothetical protein Ae707Ps1_6053c [Pseudonocardia sp. Ae707_Ps1]